MKPSCFVVLTLAFSKEADQWLAHCEELGTAIQAHNLEEAKVILQEAVLMHLNTLEDVDERDRFFRENGIKVFPLEPPKTIQVNVPDSSEVFTQAYSVPIPSYC